MNDKDIQHLMELAMTKLEQAKDMTKAKAIRSLNDAGILTTKGELKSVYQPLENTVPQ